MQRFQIGTRMLTSSPPRQPKTGRLHTAIIEHAGKDNLQFE
jgi:hypothetical protein